LYQALPILAFENEATPSSENTATESALMGTSFDLQEILDLQDSYSQTSDFSAQMAIIGDEATSSPSLVLSEFNSETTPSAQLKRKNKRPRLSKRHFKAGENLEIELGDYEAEEIEISLSDPSGEKVEVENNLLIEEEKVKVEAQGQFKPGKYYLKITKNGEILLEQDFEWGVLVIDTNKSIYLPEEQVKLAMAVLDEQGMMVCNAELHLKILDPEGEITELSIQNGEIKVNSECQLRDYTEKPDYEAVYQTKVLALIKWNC